MKKGIRSLAYLSLIVFLSHPVIFANTISVSLKLESKIPFVIKNKDCFFLAAPVVTSPIYLCRNSTANSLSYAAIASPGASLIWYETAGGTGSPTAPVPSTTAVGQTKYYVSQDDGTGESAKAEIVVNVVADTNDSIQFINCSYPAPNTIYFDWANILNHPVNAYNYSYSIQGEALVFGNEDNSSVTITGVLPGQSVTLTVTSVVGFPCIPAASKTCSLPCGTSTVTPNFASIQTSYCLNESTTNLPPNSDDSPAITGTWSPAIVITDTAGTFDYIFTPDPIMFPCALTKTLTMTVGPVEPSFSDFSICSRDSPPLLSSVSPNGITGTWFPSNIVNTTTSSSYTFTPAAGQACTPTAKTIIVTVNPSNVIVNLDWTVSEAFAKNQIVTVTDPVGVNYLYQLDDGPFQESTAFENVSLGTHSITVKDVNGCSELRNDTVLVINYPKFFTPNADGYNDTWNIFTLEDQLNSRILIFDRHGKFLKQIFPNGTGWDGTYIGQPMPANDYWFTIEYTEQDIAKKFKSHFSLKR